MIIQVNGKSHELTPPCTVADLLRQLAVSGRFAVEVNEHIVPRSGFAERDLRAGDRVEIVRAIGGG